MNSNRHIDPEDLALFALGFLAPEDASQIKRHLEECGECRQELADLRGDLAMYALTAETHSPPAMARERLMQQVSREPKQKASTTRVTEAAAYNSGASYGSNVQEIEQRPASNYGTRLTRDDLPQRGVSPVVKVLPWLGWAVAAGLAVTVGQALHERDSLRGEVQQSRQQVAEVTAQGAEARRVLDTLNDTAAQRVTLTLSKQTPVPQARATYVPQTGRLVFIASNMEPLEPYKTYELWLIPANGHDPISAGTFHPDAKGNASILLPTLPAGVTAKAFGITIEDEGGAQTPTMPIVMAGAAG